MKAIKVMSVAVSILICVFHLHVSSFAASYINDGRELIIVLDASNSMWDNDPDGLAADGIQKLVNSLPSNYNVGFLAYNNGIVNQAELSSYENRDSLNRQIDAVTYNGYTDAGSGLETAIDMFGAQDDILREIVLISDGEIIMGTADGTAASISRFDSAIMQAVDAEIPIYMIGLGNGFRDFGNSIVDAAERTGGTLYEADSAEQISGIISQILFDDLGVKKISVGIAQIHGGEGVLAVPLPAANMHRGKILMTSDSPLSDVIANFNGADVEVLNGKRFAIVNVEQPTSKSIDITFSGDGQVRAELIAEYQASLVAEIDYSDNLIDAAADTPAHIDRTANVSLRLIDKATNKNLLSEPYFDGRQIPVSISGHAQTLTVSEGSLTYTTPVLENRTLDITADLSSLDVNIICPDSAAINLEAPEEPEQPEPPFNYIPLVIIFAALIIIILFLVFRSKRKTDGKSQSPEAYISKYDYAGKINIYITKMREDIDIPPQTFNLYKLYTKKQVTVREILNECGIARPFPGTEELLLIAGKDSSLVVYNKSDATVMLGTQVVIRNKTYPMHFGEKLHITCEDELTEMEIHYKSVKPSEMH